MSRVLIAEESSLLRDVLSLALRNEQSLTLVGEARDANQTIELVRIQQPEVVLLDATIANSASELVGAIRRASDSKVLLLDAKPAPSAARKAASSGAVGYISKTTRLKRVVEAIRAVVAGGTWVDSTLPEETRDAFIAALPAVDTYALAELTEREIEVLSCVARGATNSEVAEQLNISSETVKTHMSNIFAKLGVQSRMAAAIKYHRFGISPGLTQAVA